jgi:hypothetical protein
MLIIGYYKDKNRMTIFTPSPQKESVEYFNRKQ